MLLYFITGCPLGSLLFIKTLLFRPTFPLNLN
nr:MAG TPA: hypothetical protein [Caudoviricetes sp.]